MDARGDVYLIQGNGDLRRYVLNAATSTFTSQPVGGGWNIFSSITGAGDGVIYARTPAGGLNRYQFEPSSDRFLRHPALDLQLGVPDRHVTRWRRAARTRREWTAVPAPVQA
jgi:hypothetical protein